MRSSWTRTDLFTAGLELHVGLDVVKDETEQRLALTDRIWVPPMEYKSVAPYVQLSYDIGPVTISGGARREDGELSVNDYTTTFFRNRAFVEGGTLDYQEDMLNAGAIWRINSDWSVFASYSEGFTLPNIGIPCATSTGRGSRSKAFSTCRRSSSTARKSASTGAATASASPVRITSRPPTSVRRSASIRSRRTSC